MYAKSSLLNVSNAALFIATKIQWFIVHSCVEFIVQSQIQFIAHCSFLQKLFALTTVVSLGNNSLCFFELLVFASKIKPCF